MEKQLGDALEEYVELGSLKSWIRYGIKECRKRRREIVKLLNMISMERHPDVEEPLSPTSMYRVGQPIVGVNQPPSADDLRKADVGSKLRHW